MQANNRKSMVAGNWKMNGDRELVEVMQRQLAQADLAGVEVIVCPPFPYLSSFADGMNVGAQKYESVRCRCPYW